MDDHELAERLATRCNTLEADNAALRTVMQALARYEPQVFAEDWYRCQFCPAKETLTRRTFRHAADCPVKQARTLLAKPS